MYFSFFFPNFIPPFPAYAMSAGAVCADGGKDSPMVPGFPEEKEALLLEIGRVGSRNGDVAQPEDDCEHPHPGVPRGPVVLAQPLLVEVDGVEPSEHGRYSQVAEGAV